MYKVGNTRYEIRIEINFERRRKTSYYSNPLLGTSYLVQNSCTSYKTLIFAFEMKSTAAILTFSLPAQVHHLLHHFHHSS